MNAQKDFVESDERFEAAWTHLVGECAAAKVEIVEPGLVREYLLAHSDMIDVTEKICASARREFGAETPLRLRLFIDCENDDRWLFVAICLRDYEPGFSRRLDKLMEAFDDELLQVSGEISPTIDFIGSA